MTLVLAAMLAASAAQAQEPTPKLEVTVKAVPADEERGTPPVFRVEGVTDYPDNARMSVYLHLGEVGNSSICATDTMVKDGRFSCDLNLFPKRTLPGRYVIRVLFNPHLQQMPGVKGYPGGVKLVPYTVGTAEDYGSSVREVTARLVGQINSIHGMVRCVDAEYDARKGKPFNKSTWEVFFKDLRDRVKEIETEAAKDIEYRVIGLSGVPGMIPMLRNAVFNYAWIAGMMLADPTKKGVQSAREQTLTVAENVYRKVMGAAKRLLPRPTPGECIAMVRKVGEILDRALGLSGEPLKQVRLEFTKHIMKVDADMPIIFHEKILVVIAEVMSFFEMLRSERKEEAQKILGEVKRRLGELEEAIERERLDPAEEGEAEEEATEGG